MYYSATILQEGSSSTDTSPCASSNTGAICLSAAVAFAQVVGLTIGMHVVDVFGRRTLILSLTLNLNPKSSPKPNPKPNRTLLLWSTAGVSLCLGALGFSFYGDQSGEFAVYAMVAYLVIFGIGLSPMPWTVNSEIYPQKVQCAFFYPNPLCSIWP